MLLPFTAAAQEMVIITAKDSSISSLSLKELKKIYRKEALINPMGEKWIPVNLSSHDSNRIAFSLSVFHKRPEQMEMYWNTQYFKGILPPYVVASQAAVVSFVSNTPGAIGYIFPCHLNERVKVLARIPIKSNAEKKSCRH